jgi:ribosome biogenesis protein MAK21
LKPSTTHVKPS